jgi:CRP-like cAMP-binding protein
MTNPRPPGNRILATLPGNELSRIEPLLHTVTLPAAQQLDDVGEQVDTLYFPTRGVISSVTLMEDGSSIEGLITGPEGIVGVASAFEPMTTPWQIVSQSTVIAEVAPAHQVQAIIGSMPEFTRIVIRYMLATQHLATQSIACNRFHMLAARAARWLLTVLDCVEGNEIEITHEFLAQMLGVYRPNVTTALGTLERGGMIVTQRGRIVVRERALLEAVACECYGRIESEQARVTPPIE